MKKITHGDPILVMARAPVAAIVDGPCEAHGDALVAYCEVTVWDLPGDLNPVRRDPAGHTCRVNVTGLIVNMN